MKIDWNKIVTGAIGTLISAIVLGACIIVWRGATTVQEKVKESENKQQIIIKTISESVEDLAGKVDRLTEAFEKYTQKNNKSAKDTSPVGTPTPIEPQKNIKQFYAIPDQIQRKLERK